MDFSNNTLITATKRDTDGTTWHVFENKGRKIMVKFDLDESRRELALPEEPESQLESPPKRLTETQTVQGPQCEQQSKPQSEPCPEAQPEIEDALQHKSHPETQLELDPLHVELNNAAKEADKVKSIRDRLGVSVTFLKGLLEIGNVAKDVSRSSQTRPPTDYE